MIVYRVENKDENGPYRSDWGWTIEDHNDRNHPSAADIDLCHCDEYVSGPNYFRSLLKKGTNGICCGFHSIEKFKAWFTEDERINLDDYGYVVNVYEISPEDVCILKKQCIFFKPHAKKISSKSVLDY